MHFRSSASRWGVRLLTFVAWALAAGGAVFWLLQQPPRMATGGAEAVHAAAADTAAVASALGAAGAVRPKVASGTPDGKLTLHGVITQGAGGAVLVSVEDGPAKPVRVGQAPEGLSARWALQSVAPHSAVFGAGADALELHMPPMEGRSRAGDAVAPERKAPDAGNASVRQAPVDASQRLARLRERAAARREGRD